MCGNIKEIGFMKARVFAVILALLMLLTALPAVADGTDYTLRINGGNISQNLVTVDGETCLKVDVYLDGVTDDKLLASADFDLDFDAAKLAFVSCEAGGAYAVDATGAKLGDRAAFANADGNHVRVGFASDFGCRIEEGKPFVTLLFKVLATLDANAKFVFTLHNAEAESLKLAEMLPGDDADLKPVACTVGADFKAFEGLDGWQKIDNVWYYFENGAAVTGWKKLNDKWYYFDDTGAMQTGWQKINNVWYYFTSGGKMVTGWQKIGNVWYYFQSGGNMVTGWQKISNKWYYFNTSGAMVTGWQKISNKWYYFQSGGQMVTGWQKISNKWYYFNAGGAMQTGWQKISNVWYYFQSGGQMVTGWQKINNVWYWFESSGAMFSNGSKTINGKTYNFDASGACLNP